MVHAATTDNAPTNGAATNGSTINGAATNGDARKQINGHAYPTNVLKVGIIGLGEIAQVNHIACLNNLSDYYQITYLCDASQDALDHCAARVFGNSAPKKTKDARTLCSSPDVDVVVVCSASCFHPEHAKLALEFDKYVLVEKPAAYSFRDIDEMIEVEKKSKARAFVGYQRRYATAFLDAIQEVGGMDKIIYARVRDIIGLNAFFLDQSGTFPKRFSDFKKEDTELMKSLETDMIRHALKNELGLEPSPEREMMVRILGGLGTHDLSAMRELLGMPSAVLGASLSMPLWTVMFQYPTFPVTYESGLNGVPTFDAHIEVYGQDKIVRVQYDTPYIKGLPVTMTVRERIAGEKGSGYQERIVRKTYEDPYTLEFLEFWKCASQGLQPKTSLEDARRDLELFQMILKA